MQNSYIESGNHIRVYDSAVQTHDELPVGTYIVRFSEVSGYSLQRVEALSAGTETVYGHRADKVTKMFRSYHRFERSMGVMMSGDKGQGKSLFIRMLADTANEEGLPVVRVTQDSPGIAEFIDTLGECVIIFDEFEKVFPNGARGSRDETGGSNRQVQFLPMFDGSGTNKRLYVVAFNEINDISTYLLNRPGRFHYHIRFSYPGPNEVRTYITEQTTGATEKQITAVVDLSRKVSLNYDHLRAIAFELDAAGPDALFAELIEDLNIKPTEKQKYNAAVTYSDGVILRGSVELDAFCTDGRPQSVYINSNARSCYTSVNASEFVYTADGTIVVPVTAITGRDTDPVAEGDDDDDEAQIIKMEFRLAGQSTYHFGAF